jgi:hypothetical protein
VITSGQVILATGGGGDWQLPALGGWLPVVWCVVALVGYLAFMFLNPLRGYFGESFDLLSEKGHAKLWAIVGVLSIPGFVWDWWRTVPVVEAVPTIGVGGFQAMTERPEPLVLATGVLENIAAVFSVVISGSEFGIGIGAKHGFVELAGGALLLAIAFLIQYFILLFIYLRVMMPGRALKMSNLIDLSVRRIGTTWPILVACWIAFCVPLSFGFAGTLQAVWSIVFSVLFIVFAFMEVAVLGKNVPLGEAVGLNFSGWRTKAMRAAWFLAGAALHAVLLYFAEFLLRSTVDAGTWLAVGLGVIFVFVRGFVLVWLMGAWVVIWAD